MTKPIPMTIERFFKLLPKTKKLHPRLTNTKAIRFDGGGCPLSALKKVLTGKGIRPIGSFTLESSFNFPRDSRRPSGENAVRLLMKAADNNTYPGVQHTTARLRRRMLRTLGLKKKYAR